MMTMVWLLKTLYREFFDRKIYDLAAQMSYYFLLSLFPFLIVVFTMVGHIPIDTISVLDMVEPYAPEQTIQFLRHTLNGIFANQEKNLLTFGFIASIWLSSFAIQSFSRILNESYPQRTKSSFLVQLLEGLLLTIAFISVVVISVLVPVAERFVLSSLNEDAWLFAFIIKFWNPVKWIVGSFVLFCFFYVLYQFVPKARLKFIEVLPGAVFSTIIWQLISLGFSFYVRYSQYSIIYGNVKTLIILMIWLYLTAQTLILGGTINALLFRKKYNLD
ncbi:YihY/virulence factor BrkB family protein [Pseudalkalibacillus salsuginis]|uniref:YihY/virulence factor BrkB family protein n=1 Tax=Pseudalkalibacillus salsuginis TaxID=2910972 RepID=UPI001F3C6741|nr:YihY/virulence factor BrkB family protein [Pseudalkalibacillus salsuginis]MCF6409943.1 YihY/virulence factor BrkB family protein [Pseudalkalibacillus salsuginis]